MLRRFLPTLALIALLTGCGAATATAVQPTQTPYVVTATAAPTVPVPTQTPRIVVITATPATTATPAVVEATATPTRKSDTSAPITRSSVVSSSMVELSSTDVIALPKNMNPDERYLAQVISQGFGHGAHLDKIFSDFRRGQMASAQVVAEASSEYTFAKAEWQAVGTAMEPVKAPLACIARASLINMDANEATASFLVSAAHTKDSPQAEAENMASAGLYDTDSVGIDFFVQDQMKNLADGKPIQQIAGYFAFTYILSNPFEGKDVYATPGCS